LKISKLFFSQYPLSVFYRFMYGDMSLNEYKFVGDSILKEIL